jgi:hypothetical protein
LTPHLDRVHGMAAADTAQQLNGNEGLLDEQVGGCCTDD